MQTEALVASEEEAFQVVEASPAVVPVEEAEEAGRNTGFFQKIIITSCWEI